MQQLRAARDERRTALRPRIDDEADAFAAVGHGRDLDELGQGQRAEGQAGVAFRPCRQPGQDVTATLALTQEQLDIGPERAVRRQIAIELLGDDRDGAERAAEPMRGRGGEAAQG